MTGQLAERIADSLRFHMIHSRIRHHQSGKPLEVQWRCVPHYSCHYCLSGSNLHRFSDSKPIRLNPGQAVLLREGEMHSQDNLRAEEWWFVTFRFTAFGSVDALSFFDLQRVYTGLVTHEIKRVMKELMNIEGKAKPLKLADYVLRKSLGCRFFNALTLNARPRESRTQNFDTIQRMLPALKIINNLHFENICVEDLATSVHLSPSRFHALFQQAFGTSPLKFRQNVRLGHAKDHLARGNLTISEIAEKTGFSDPLYFSRLFHKHVGVSPTDYRQFAEYEM